LPHSTQLSFSHLSIERDLSPIKALNNIRRGKCFIKYTDINAKQQGEEEEREGGRQSIPPKESTNSLVSDPN
jgi:hypothetical protein